MNIWKRLPALTLAMTLATPLWAANTKTQVTQVTTSVTVDTPTDYVITSDTPFAVSGSVDITNTDHGVVIISKIRPSKVIANWLGHVYVNGQPAVNNQNCQVKMYGSGAIILPYSKDLRPLQCFTQPNFGGTPCDNYTEGSDNGYMKTLGAATLGKGLNIVRTADGSVRKVVVK